MAHVIGQAALFSTPFELARQVRAAKARRQAGQAAVDALTAFQVESGSTSGPKNYVLSCTGSARAV